MTFLGFVIKAFTHRSAQQAGSRTGSGARSGADGNSQVEVCAVRQVSGALTAKSIGKSEKPTERLN